MTARTCRHGHALEGANVFVNVRGSVECRECIRARTRRRRKSETIVLPEKDIRAIIGGLREGKTLKALLKGARGRAGRVAKSDQVSTAPWQHYKNTLRLMPKVGRIITKLVAENSLKAKSQGATERHRRNRLIAAPALLRNDGYDAFNAIQAATRHLADPMRGEIQSRLWLDVAEARLSIRQIPAAVASAIKQFNRDERYSVTSRWGHRSLDAKFGDDEGTLLDVVAADPDGAWSPVAFSSGRRIASWSSI